MKWLHILKLDQCFGEGELVWFLRVKKEKKYTGSPSVVALSMAPTEGNGPYSNSLKDEGYERFKCTDTRGRKGQKREAGEGWRGPIPCLIESPFRTANTSLKNKGRKKKRAACCSYSIMKHRKPRECICFITSTEHPSVSPKEAGGSFVIYDNCSLQKCKYIMTIISRDVRTLSNVTFHQMRAEKLLKLKCVWCWQSERGWMWCQNTCTFTHEWM